MRFWRLSQEGFTCQERRRRWLRCTRCTRRRWASFRLREAAGTARWCSSLTRQPLRIARWVVRLPPRSLWLAAALVPLGPRRRWGTEVGPWRERRFGIRSTTFRVVRCRKRRSRLLVRCREKTLPGTALMRMGIRPVIPPGIGTALAVHRVAAVRVVLLLRPVPVVAGAFLIRSGILLPLLSRGLHLFPALAARVSLVVISAAFSLGIPRIRLRHLFRAGTLGLAY